MRFKAEKGLLGDKITILPTDLESTDRGTMLNEIRAFRDQAIVKGSDVAEAQYEQRVLDLVNAIQKWEIGTASITNLMWKEIVFQSWTSTDGVKFFVLDRMALNPPS